VRSRAPLISQTVQSRLGYPTPSLFDDTRKRRRQLEDDLMPSRDDDSDSDDSDENAENAFPTLSAINRFLFGSRAFQRLVHNLEQDFPKLEDQTQILSSRSQDNKADDHLTPLYPPLSSGLLKSGALTEWSIFSMLSNKLGPSTQTLEKANVQRMRWMRWKCRCGKAFYDDYEEDIPGAVKMLQDYLNTSYGTSKIANNERGTIVSAGRGFPSLLTSIKRIFRRSQDPEEALPVSTVRTPRLRPNPTSSTERLLFLLTCLKAGSAPSLIQEEVCNVNSDQDFFRLLRTLRQKHRSRFHSLFTFNKVVRIKFVHFELFPRDLVNVLVEDCPPIDSGYIPVKDSFATFPPIGSAILVHLYGNPEHADISKLLLGRVRKKLDTKLQICQIKRHGYEWGLELVEGLNWRKVWIVGFFGLTLSCLFGLLWSVLKDNVQGGWAVAACMMMIVPCFTGKLHSSHW
jgi:hypothetical protein